MVALRERAARRLVDVQMGQTSVPRAGGAAGSTFDTRAARRQAGADAASAPLVGEKVTPERRFLATQTPIGRRQHRDAERATPQRHHVRFLMARAGESAGDPLRIATIGSRIYAAFVHLFLGGVAAVPLILQFRNVVGTVAVLCVLVAGKSNEVPCVTISQVREGKFVDMRDYFDLLTGMTQLGLMPDT